MQMEQKGRGLDTLRRRTTQKITRDSILSYIITFDMWFRGTKKAPLHYQTTVVTIFFYIVMYVPFCVTVLFCVLFVCECVLENCHRDIGALSDYPN
jgi:hypothetical protein